MSGLWRKNEMEGGERDGKKVGEKERGERGMENGKKKVEGKDD